MKSILNQDFLLRYVASQAVLDITSDQLTGFSILGNRVSEYHGALIQKSNTGLIAKDLIFLNVNKADALWYMILFHELAHATGRKAFLNRQGLNHEPWSYEAYSFEEIIAQKTSDKLLMYFGLNSEKIKAWSSDYISGYEKNLKSLDETKLNQDVEAAFRLVLSWLDAFDFKNESTIMKKVQNFHGYF